MGVRCVSEDELRLMAEADWQLAAAEAMRLGLDGTVDLFRPAQGADWREIDRCIMGLMTEIYRKKRVRRYSGGVR